MCRCAVDRAHQLWLCEKTLDGRKVIDGVAYACCSHNVFDPHHL